MKNAERTNASNENIIVTTFDSNESRSVTTFDSNENKTGRINASNENKHGTKPGSKATKPVRLGQRSERGDETSTLNYFVSYGPNCCRDETNLWTTWTTKETNKNNGSKQPKNGPRPKPGRRPTRLE